MPQGRGCGLLGWHAPTTTTLTKPPRVEWERVKDADCEYLDRVMGGDWGKVIAVQARPGEETRRADSFGEDELW